MPRQRLTLQRISDFSCPEGKGQAFLWDTEAPRLAVRVTPSGRKAFVFESKLGRQTIRATVGDVRDWAIDGARAEARRMQTLVDQGIDPRQDKADKAAARRIKAGEAKVANAPALDAWASYMEAKRSRWSARHYLDHQAAVREGGEPRKRGARKGESDTVKPGALRGLLSDPLPKIDADAVAHWLETEAASRPTHAALCFRLLRSFINWCASHKDYRTLVHADACSARSVREHIPKAKAKDDCLQREQLAPWFKEVQAIKNPVISAYLQILLITGARREEGAGIRWDTDVDFRWKRIRLGDKVEDERWIPMTPYVESLLLDLKEGHDERLRQAASLRAKRGEVANSEDLQWVFLSPTAESARLQDPSSQHRAACSKAGICGLTLHGLRRSFGTLCEWVEVPVGIVAQIMGHKPSATAEKHYRRRPIDLLRKWHTTIETWLLSEAGVVIEGRQ